MSRDDNNCMMCCQIVVVSLFYPLLGCFSYCLLHFPLRLFSFIASGGFLYFSHNHIYYRCFPFILCRALISVMTPIFYLGHKSFRYDSIDRYECGRFTSRMHCLIASIIDSALAQDFKRNENHQGTFLKVIIMIGLLMKLIKFIS